MLQDETLGLLRRFDVSLDPALDEQQLVDRDVIDRLISDAEVGKHDTVLDVGAGCGNITVALAERAKRVIAIEKDPKFIPILESRVGSLGNVEVIIGDALRMDLPRFDKIASNLPYRICEAFVQRLIHLEFTRAALVLPTSFAETLGSSAEDSEYSKLSLIAGAFFTIERREEVRPEAYYPASGTLTRIVTLEARAPRDVVEAVMRRVLARSDMKLRNALREALIEAAPVGVGPSTKREANAVVRSMGLGSLLDERVARLSLGDLQKLYVKLKPFT